MKKMEQRREDHEESDEELLQRALGAPEGDLRAFEQLVLKYQTRIVADCRFMTRDDASADDLAQETFVKAFFGLRSFEGRSSFRHWLQRIKVHHCLNHIKKEQGQKWVSIEEESAEEPERLQVAPAVYEEFEASDSRERIANVLESLPATLRIPLVMRDMDELSYAEIARSLDIGLSAAKMRIKRAREEFRLRYQNTAGAAKSQSRSA